MNEKIKNIKFYYKNVAKKIGVSKRILLFFPWYNELTNFYRIHEFLSEKIEKHPKLLKKLNRPYLSIYLSTREKLDFIKDSYSVLDEKLNIKEKEILYTTGQLKLFEFVGKAQKKYSSSTAEVSW